MSSAGSPSAATWLMSTLLMRKPEAPIDNTAVTDATSRRRGGTAARLRPIRPYRRRVMASICVLGRKRGARVLFSRQNSWGFATATSELPRVSGAVARAGDSEKIIYHWSRRESPCSTSPLARSREQMGLAGMTSSKARAFQRQTGILGRGVEGMRARQAVVS
jgi:hypothetical protein